MATKHFDVPDVKLTEELVLREWLGEDSLRFRRLLAGFRERVSGEGTAVVIAEEDPVAFLAAFFAVLLAGRPAVLGNSAWGRREWAEAVEATGAKMILATGREECPALSRTIATEGGEILIPTGGTGGRLRFARHTWRTFTAAAGGFARFFDAWPVNSVCVLPLFHVSGLAQAVRALATGGKLQLLDWRKLEAGACPAGSRQFLSLVPTQLRKLLEVEAIHGWLRELRAIPLGGGPAAGGLLAEAARLKMPVAPSYGMTETAAMVTAQTPGQFLEGCRTSGRALPHVSVRIADADGKNVAPGGEGRISVMGPSLFGGYIRGEARQGEEWVTGDVGFLDEEGHLTVNGREDRVVVSGGEKVSPEEVERVLVDSGLVEDVWVFGVKDAQWGQAVVAVFVSRNAPSIADLREAVRKELAAYKVPKHWIPVEAIPRTVQGKVDCEALEARVREGRL